MSDRKYFAFMTLLVVLVFAFACGFWWVSSYFEAQAYNRVTGGDVTTWEAMWVNLRVDGDR